MLSFISNPLRELRDFRKLFSPQFKEKRRLVFYSERDIYYLFFESYIKHVLAHSDLHVTNLTSDPRDPVFALASERFHPLYISLSLVACIGNLEANALVMTMPDLDNFHVKRSKNALEHVYLFHSMGSTHLQYSKHAFDAYDTIFCIGPQDEGELRRAEEVYGLHPRNLVRCGYGRVEDIYRQWQARTPSADHVSTLLVAPSWHPGNILETCIEDILRGLAESEHRVIVRPHPETIARDPKLIQRLKGVVAGNNRFQLEMEMTRRTSILEADLLVTDWSAISYEYAFGTERPVLFVNTECKVFNQDYRELGIEPMELTVRDKIGKAVELGECASIAGSVHELISNRAAYRDRIVGERGKALFNWLASDRVGGEYLIALGSKRRP
jgi:YidC/Oxa1 family membrane protein insertase